MRKVDGGLRPTHQEIALKHHHFPYPHLIRVLALVLCLAPAALAGLLLSGCAADDTQASEGKADGPQAAAVAPEEDKTVPVEVARLERGPIEAVLRFSTNLEAEQSVAVYSQAARQVVDLRVEEGDHVNKGEVLVRLQDDEQKLQVAKVQGQIDKAKREYERQERLYKDELIPEQDFNQATYELKQLELQLEEAQRQLSYTEVRAPIGGTITRRLVNLGDQVTVNQHLFDIVDFDSLVARVYVPEKELQRLDVGLPARLTVPALGGAGYDGKVIRLAPIVDPNSGTLKVTVGIPDWKGLRPGLYVDVALVTDVHQAALLVPKRALVYDQDQVFVYRLVDTPAAEGGRKAEDGVTKPEGANARSGADEGAAATDPDAPAAASEPTGPTVERLRLVPQLEDKLNVEPAGTTLAPGDRLVIAGQAGLKDGVRVRVLDRSSADDVAAEQAEEPDAERALEEGASSAQ